MHGVGPGTGLAPMRALLQELQYLRTRQPLDAERERGACVLYFGCQHPDQDYIYRYYLVYKSRTLRLKRLFLLLERN